MAKNIGRNMTGRYLVTESIVESFAKIVGDYNPVHLDQQFAKQTIFKGRIAHGMIPLGFMNQLCYKNKLIKFLKPIYLGEQVLLNITTKQLLQNEYELGCKITKGQNQIVTIVNGKAKDLLV